MARRVHRRRQYADMSWKEKWVVFKANRRKPGWVELLIYGILLNMGGACLLLIKAQLDKDIIEATVINKFIEAGIQLNSTMLNDKERATEPNPVFVVMMTMAGRMANVVGTMKMYKALGKFLTARKKKKFQTATERMQNGETEAECTELFSECCQIF